MQYIEIAMSLSDISKSMYRVKIAHGNKDCDIFGREITLYIDESNANKTCELDTLVNIVKHYRIRHIVIQSIHDIKLREMIKIKFKDVDIIIYECKI